MTLLLLLACASGPEVEATLLSGFSLEWDALSHRISSLDLALEPDGAGEMGLIGGDWSTGENASDFPLWSMQRSWIRTTEASFAYASGPLSLQAPFEGRLSLSVESEDLALHPELDAVISALRVRADVPQTEDFPEDYDPADGWPVLALSVEVLEVRRTDTGAEVELAARFEPGPTGESVLDRPEMDAAMPYATLTLELGATLIAHEGDVDTQTLSASVQHPYDPPYSDHEPLVMPLEPMQRPGVTAWRRFSVVLNGGTGNHGDYLRALGLGLGSEQATATVSGSSVLEIAPLSVAFEGEVLQLTPRGAEVEDRSASGEAEVGTWSVE